MVAHSRMSTAGAVMFCLKMCAVPRGFTARRIDFKVSQQRLHPQLFFYFLLGAIFLKLYPKTGGAVLELAFWHRKVVQKCCIGRAFSACGIVCLELRAAMPGVLG